MAAQREPQMRVVPFSAFIYSIPDRLLLKLESKKYKKMLQRRNCTFCLNLILVSWPFSSPSLLPFFLRSRPQHAQPVFLIFFLSSRKTISLPCRGIFFRFFCFSLRQIRWNTKERRKNMNVTRVTRQSTTKKCDEFNLVENFLAWILFGQSTRINTFGKQWINYQAFV